MGRAGLTALFRNFLFPEINRKFLIRAIGLSVCAWLIFTYLLIPFRVKGHSMEPTYKNGDVNFCYTLRYMVSPPRRFDVVAIRFAGAHAMLLKRVIGLEGERIEFKEGALFINGRKIQEPYVTGKCDWNLPPRIIKPRHVYVAGDNRSVPMETHDFGQTDIHRIIGSPLW